ncbi:dienelactone hydrolase family protein [Paenibacillus soyae]|uniref:Dienelactone hydrolase family protein n=1 Tax=Paenibacillus soyae TaxID=2969249 RepID=A0A9X2SAK2_9BACL|nr:dienelactone hydrolase family protein [Paenibacillus soyae]MCR2804683.1 dienelactone hydrolase family protein [Paenibacillus soyae]
MSLSLIREWVSYGGNNRFTGYAARLQGLRETAPAVIVLQEIWGVDAHIRSVADRFAAAGYIAFAPDLFADGGTRPEALSPDRIDLAKSFLNTLPSASWRNAGARQVALTELPPDEARRIEETLSRVLNLSGWRETFNEKTAAAASFLRGEHAPTLGQGVAAVGFCLGGALAAELAAHDQELKGAVLFYGGFPSDENAALIQAPLLGFYGERDERITGAVPAFAELAKKQGKRYEYHVYPGAGHAFFNDSRPSYHAPSARDAYARTLGFLNLTLKG